MITKIFLVIILIVSVIALKKDSVFERLYFSPYIIKRKKQWERFFSHALVHADWMHLTINMYVFYHFGNSVEFLYDYKFSNGSIYYIVLLIVGIIVAAIPSYIKHRNNSNYIAVGASGTVSAIVFSFIVLKPLDPLRLVFIPFNIPAIFLGLAYLIYSYVMSKKKKGRIAHDAHFWGGIFGIVYTFAIYPNAFYTFIEIIRGFLYA
jgi:membrane associated rhomboid family serine protease